MSGGGNDGSRKRGVRRNLSAGTTQSEVPMSEAVGAMLLAELADGYRALKTQAEDAIAQLGDEELFARLDPETNSIAVIIRHMSGNMRSRWTDFLTTDGEKPERDRDGEFEDPERRTRAALLEEWEGGWQCLDSALAELGAEHLGRTITIGGKPFTVLRALERATRHYAAHVGQIVLLAKHARGAAWRSLSIPRGQSRAHTGSTRA
jgi:hypothetical protein